MRSAIFAMFVFLFFVGCGGSVYYAWDDAGCGYDYCYVIDEGNEARVKFDFWGDATCYYNGVNCDYSQYCRRYGYMDYDCWKTKDKSEWTDSNYNIEHYHAFNITDYGIFAKDFDFWF